jgi:hypothetical protein
MEIYQKEKFWYILKDHGFRRKISILKSTYDLELVMKTY